MKKFLGGSSAGKLLNILYTIEFEFGVARKTK
jgi:hypothetical protein